MGTKNAGYRRGFLCPDKKSKAKEQFYNAIPDALHDLHTSKCKIPNNQPNDAYLRKAAESIKVCISKQLQFGASIEKVNGNQAKTSKDSKMMTSVIIYSTYLEDVLLNLSLDLNGGNCFLLTKEAEDRDMLLSSAILLASPNSLSLCLCIVA